MSITTSKATRRSAQLKLAVSEYWRSFDTLTVSEAVALWCGIEPFADRTYEPPEITDFRAIKRMIVTALEKRELNALDRFALIGNHDKSTVEIARLELVRWATTKNFHPSFLSPDGPTPADGEPPRTDNEPAKKRGRPQEYDWHGMNVEMVRVADVDGLPPNATALVDQLLQWFTTTHGKEPARSEVHKRIDPIYRGLRDLNWVPNRER